MTGDEDGQPAGNPQSGLRQQPQTVPVGFQGERSDVAMPSNQTVAGQDSGPQSGGPGSPDESGSDLGGTPAPADVSPDEDVYSMQDARLGADMTLNQDDLAKMFDVSKVEDFSADDPANPLNVQRRRQERQAGE